MIKAVSLHKAWIARTAGLFVLSALAVSFFVTPIALGANGNGNAPKTLTTFKANFVGKVDGTLPPGVTIQNFKVGNTAFKVTMTPTLPFASLTKGAWLFVDVVDASNSNYGFLATVDTINPTTHQVKVLIGPPGDPSKVSATAIKQFEGNELFLNFNKDATGTLMKPIPGPAGTGWSSGPATQPVA